MESVTLARPPQTTRRWLLLALVPSAFLIVVLFVTTSVHNGQLKAQVEVHNAQLAGMTATHNQQLAKLTEECNARLQKR